MSAIIDIKQHRRLRVDPAGVGSDDWCTERWIAQALGEFALDPCGNERSHVQAETVYLGVHVGDRDGLVEPWQGSVFVNCPYSAPLPWCRRLIAHDGPWVALLKLDPSTRWWATLMEGRPQWAPFRRRIKYERPDKPPLTANFPSVLVWRDWTPGEALRSVLWLDG